MINTLRSLYSVGEDKINKYAVNMNLAFIDGKFDKCVNRDNEIGRICEILMRKNKNNPCLIGKSGVGKTAVVEGLVSRIVELKMKELEGGQKHPLGDKIIFSLDLTCLTGGTRYRGDLEERLDDIIGMVKAYPNVILFIDEIHMITRLNDSEASGTVGVGQILKAPLSRGDISIIGATTEDEYADISKDKALERRFSCVQIKEFTHSNIKPVAKAICETYSRYHKICIPDDVMELAVKYADEFYKSRVFPDKFIDIIDETSARVRLNNCGQKQTPTLTPDDLKKTVFNQTGKIVV